jgi:hypothetical protein
MSNNIILRLCISLLFPCINELKYGFFFVYNRQTLFLLSVVFAFFFSIIKLCWPKDFALDSRLIYADNIKNDLIELRKMEKYDALNESFLVYEKVVTLLCNNMCINISVAKLQVFFNFLITKSCLNQ